MCHYEFVVGLVEVVGVGIEILVGSDFLKEREVEVFTPFVGRRVQVVDRVSVNAENTFVVSFFGFLAADGVKVCV